MATLGANTLNIHDVIRRSKPDGTMAVITEMLAQQNGLVDDAPWVQGDLPGGTYSTQRTSLPTWATINPNGTFGLSKSSTGQNLEPVEHMGSMLDMELLVATYGGDPSWKLSSEAVAFLEGGKQAVAGRILSGNGATTPGQINGLQTRYNLTTAVNGRNVILGGALAGQTDCMSAYFVKWGERNVYCFYPPGTQAGLESHMLGQRVSEPSSTTRKIVYSAWFKWSFGLAVPNWTSVARVCNIDKSLLIAGTGADLFDKFTMAFHCLARNNDGRAAIYMNTTTRMMLDIQARNDVQAGGQLSYANVDGKMIETYRGIPINLEDQLTEGESVVS